MRRYLIIAAILAIFVVGFIFLRGPIPHIAIAAEELTTVGGVKITNTMVTSWVIVVLIILSLAFIMTRTWTIVPGGVQNFVEAVVEAFYNLVTGIAGEENGRRFFPVVASIFFFVLIANWMSLTPIFNAIGFVGHEEPVEQQLEEHGYVEGIIMDRTKIGPIDLHYIPFSGLGNLRISSDDSTIELDEPESPDKYQEAIEDDKFVGELIPLFRGINTDLNTPLAIAIASAIAVEWWGISSLGLFAYGKKFINFSGPIDFFVGILELISELVRLVSFTFRLFGNMFAGEVVILMFTFLTPLLITLPFYGLELFVGVIQAFIFASLTLVFGVMAVTSHDHDDEHAESHKAESIEESVHEAIAEPTG